MKNVKSVARKGFFTFFKVFVLISFVITLSVALGHGAPPDGKGAPAAQDKPGFVADEILVKFTPGLGHANERSQLKAGGASSIKRFRIGVHHVKLPPGLSVEKALERFRKNPNVEYAEPNFIDYIDETVPNDTNFGRLWAHKNTRQWVDGVRGTTDADMDTVEAWDISTGSGSVIVAVLDTGMQINHSDLNANVWRNSGETNNTNGIDDDGNGYKDDRWGWDFVFNNKNPNDGHGHGSHVAGTIGAVGNNNTGVAGVVWTVSLMALRVCNSSGSCTHSDQIEAIEYATDNGADVINMSLSGASYSQSIKDALDAFGGVVAAAAGNNNPRNNDANPRYPASYTSNHIIAVAASNQSDGLAWFSHYGAKSVDLAAPGENIWSTRRFTTSYMYRDGTSMATPQVAGLAALIMANFPSLTTLEVVHRILATVDKKGAFSGKMTTGGRANAYKALSTPGFDLSVTVNGTGRVTSSPVGVDCSSGTCTTELVSGAVVTLMATGATFIGWSGSGCSGTGTCVVTMDSAKAVTADFYSFGAQQFGTSSTETGYNVAVDANGNPFVAGYTAGGLNGNPDGGSYDIFLSKFNSGVNHLWTAQPATSSDDRGRDVGVDANGNSYVTGYTKGALHGNANAGNNDIVLIKYDTGGSRQWTVLTGTTSNDYGFRVAADAAGNSFVAGRTDGALHGNSHAGGRDVFLSKYNTSGVRQWTVQEGTTGTEYARGVALDADGNIYVTGTTSGGLHGNVNAGSGDIFLIKYNSSGARQWTVQTGTGSNDDPFGGVEIDPDGNIYLAGYTSGWLHGNVSAGGEDIFLMKFDPGGNRLWTVQTGTSVQERAYGLAVDRSGNTYLSGYTKGGLHGNTNAGSNDLYGMKFDSRGNRLWTTQMGTSESDVARGMEVDSSGNAYLTGQTSGPLFVKNGFGGADVFLLKIDSLALDPPPDLTATKTNNVGGQVVQGNPWTWTTRVSNIAAVQASLPNGTELFRDKLPNGVVTYSNVSITSQQGISGPGQIDCSLVAGPDLVCTANGDVTIFDTGYFDVAVQASTTTLGTYANPRVTDGCKADPNGSVGETNEANNTCSDSVLVTDDGDGVSDATEDGAPNGGDGNDDGIPDKYQTGVTSLPAATANGYLTLESTCPHQNVQTFLESDLAEQDRDYNYNFGLISFELPCENATVRLYYHGATHVDKMYRKYGPLAPAFGPPEWYTLPGVVFAQQTIPAEGGVPTWYAEFALCDGCVGDDTDGTDDVIYDQGGPAFALVPTLGGPGMAIFITLAGLGALYYLRRKKATG